MSLPRLLLAAIVPIPNGGRRMVQTHQKLSSKIIAILVLFFLVATLAIGMTLFISWQLEGASAAINDAGSQRMRSYRLGWLLHKAVNEAGEASQIAEQAARVEVDTFEQVLAGLKQGDPARPLTLSHDSTIQAAAARMRDGWQNRMRPLILGVLESPGIGQRQQRLAQYDAEVVTYVDDINLLVLEMERNYSRGLKVLRLFQLGLVLLALMGTIVLIYYFFVLIIRPVRQLQTGIGRMAGEDFSVRLPVAARDEFGVLADGFNRMAGHLEDLYGTLEERVEAKTRSLEEKNNELAALYEIAAFLNEPAAPEELCRGFIRRVMRAVGAQGGAVRLYDGKSQKLFMLVYEGVSEQFAEREAALCSGECICGEAIQTTKTVVFNTSAPPPNMSLFTCKREGFVTVAAFNISCNKRAVGVYNLYFTSERGIDERERHLLETLGQHLGGAVENQRLVSRDKELAVAEERNLLAQELHDSIAQGLAFLNIKVQLLVEALKEKDIAGALEESGSIREGVQESYDDVRELLTHFRTRVREADLEAAVAGSLLRFEGQTGIRTHFARLGSGAPLAAEYETQALHIVQESLSNIRKHARAQQVEVRMEHRLKEVVLSIADDGVGFAADGDGDASEQHVGLKIMKERAHRIGATLQVCSRPGEGTTISLTLPRVYKETA